MAAAAATTVTPKAMAPTVSQMLVAPGGATAVKLEGGAAVAPTVERLVSSGIPVMGHLGLTPQSATLLGGYRAQARSAERALETIRDARQLEAAGASMLVLEAIPPEVAERVTEALSIPTIGIGAGAHCDGQVLVYHDVIGLTEGIRPRFVRQYAAAGDDIRRALSAYSTDVKSGAYPGPEHAYTMPPEELERFAAAQHLPHT